MKHILLIGFKNTGKTVIGKGLAEKLALEFVDLDGVVEKKYGKGMKCREIMQKEGEMAFRRIETEALEEVLSINAPLVLALGGGAAEALKNQELIQGHTVVLITGPKEVLFERIMKKGRPAIFEKGLSDRDAFEKLYAEREPVYERIAKIKVQNEKSIDDAINEIISKVDSSFSKGGGR